MANLKKVLAYAKEQGIADLVLHHSIADLTEVVVENCQHEKTRISSDSSFVATGVIDGHFVSFNSDNIDSRTAKVMVETMKSQKDYSRPFDPDLIIAKPEGLEYAKNKTYSRKLDSVTPDQLIALGESVAKAIHSADERIVNSCVTAEVATSTSRFLNSKNLSLSSRSNYIAVAAEVVAKKGDEIQSDFVVEIASDIKKLSPEKIAKKVVGEVVKRFGSKPGVAGTMKACLTPAAVAPLLKLALSHLSMFSIDQNLSLLADSLDKKIFSELLTVEEKPNSNNIFASSYDSEGYPTINKTLIEKGVVKTYLYDQEMAKKYHHVPTGNGLGSLNTKPGLTNIHIKPGEGKQKDLVHRIDEGYLVTNTTGENAGLNPQTGNFTLSASGIYIKDGRTKFPVQQFTISGNIIELYKSIIAVGSDLKQLPSGDMAPSILFDNLVIGC